MSNGYDTGKSEVVQYKPDGSEVHVVYDLNGSVVENGEVRLKMEVWLLGRRNMWRNLIAE